MYMCVEVKAHTVSEQWDARKIWLTFANSEVRGRGTQAEDCGGALEAGKGKESDPTKSLKKKT